MFERYTEKARRVIFFARYEASQFGSKVIETEHLLLGLLREDQDLSDQFLPPQASVESLRHQIEEHSNSDKKTSTSVDLPLSQECKHVLSHAAEESERLNHKHIGTPHLLLGILREEKSFAAALLRERGLRLDSAREEVLRSELERADVPARAASAPPSALLELVRAWADGGAVTVAAKPGVAAHTPDFGVFRGSGPAQELIRIRQEITEIVKRTENAIAAHNFEEAGICSEEERKARALLREKTEQMGLHDLPEIAAPVLCIELADDQRFSLLLRRCDDYLAQGVEQVWLIDAGAKRAYAVTAADGLRECREDSLRLTDPPLELNLQKLFA